ncbi:hypothetical protein V1514DRAFT_335649 [Lipomyces japonicus]|uniref:uncharacterized protein n=1 Tax=Lipomyces japonicus TaxID=56871 RepID=UPI0034CEB0FF
MSRQRVDVPLWMLSPKEEGIINTRHGEFAREKCKDILQAFTDCNRGRLLSTSWACKKESDAMLECMLNHMDYSYREKIIDDYLKEKQETARKSKGDKQQDQQAEI